MARAILGIGPKDVASIEYLKDNDAAMVATDSEEMNNLVKRLKEDTNFLMDYSKKGLAFAMTQMNAEEMKMSLYNDMKAVIDEYNKTK